MMSKVSIVIPIYNVKNYLEKCLDSVVNQTYKNLEIICVNDCSPDGCDKILEKYAAKDERIKIVNREKNGGLSAARNSGLDVANGEYIYFLDSDDWIDLDYINQMVQTIEKTGVDIVLNTNVLSVKDGATEPFLWTRYSLKPNESEFLTTEDAVNKSHVMIWTHLYKTNFLKENNLRFPEGFIQEDEYFQHISKIKTDKIFCFHGSAYYYLQRTQSIMTVRKSIAVPIAKILSLLIDFYSQNNFLSKYKIKLTQFNIVYNINDDKDFAAAKEVAQKLLNSNLNFAFSDFDWFRATILANCESLGDLAKKFKNLALPYMRKGITQKFKVSVIVPMFKSEPYLRKCLDSLIYQTLRDIEIICINDGSPDGCAQIVKKYQAKDNRIKLINFSENKGVSIARNTAMAQAKGEFIGFVDADDWVDLDFYEKLYNAAMQNDCEFAKGKLKLIKNEIEENSNNSRLFCLGIYKKDFLKKNEIIFKEGCVCGEDQIFIAKTEILASNKIYLDNTFYNYLQREGSASFDYFKNEEQFNSDLKAFCEVCQFLTNEINKLPNVNADINDFIPHCAHYIKKLNNEQRKTYIEMLFDEFGKIKDKERTINKYNLEILKAIETKQSENLFSAIKKAEQLKNKDEILNKLRRRIKNEQHA